MNRINKINDLIRIQHEHGLVEMLSLVYGRNVRISIPFSDMDCTDSIEELSLSVRSINALRRTGVFTIGDLIDKLNHGDLKSIRNLGTKSIKEIQIKILVYGFEKLTETEKMAFFCNLVDENNPTENEKKCV